MPSVNKGSGKYFYQKKRVWDEAERSGVDPFIVGDFGGRIPIPRNLTQEYIRDLCTGKPLKHVQANRIGNYDVTFTFSKSVSLVLFGLTPHEQWAQKSTKLLVDATRPEVVRLVNNQHANSGAKGARKVESKGVAFGFCHWESSRAAVHGHVHYAIPNVTSPEKGGPRSIAKVRETMYESQGLMRARANKRLDDLLQDRGFKTVREGNSVAVAGIPKKLVEELSPSRRAMNEAAKKLGFTSPKAQAFYARHARSESGPRKLGDPKKLNETCWKLAKRHGLEGFDDIKRPVEERAKHRNVYQAASTAHDVAASAKEWLSKKHGKFTEEQFLERVFKNGIGRETTFEALDTYARAALKNEKFLGIKKEIKRDGRVLYKTPQSQAAAEKAREHFRSDTRAAWEDLKKAARGFGGAAFVSTAKKATGVFERLSHIVNPPPRTLTLDARKLGAFTDRLRPTGYVKAHAKALFAGLTARGNPHDRAYVAERAFAKLREHDRLEKNTVVVVRRGDLASPRDLHVLTKIAKRDGASVILSDSRGRSQQRGNARNQRQHNQHQKQNQNQRQHQNQNQQQNQGRSRGRTP